MDNKNATLRIVSILSIIGVLLPAIVGVFHFADDHDHLDHCDVLTVEHVHEQKIDCFDLHFTILPGATYDIAANTPRFFTTQVTHYHLYTPNQVPTLIFNTQGRGPPNC